MTDSEHFATPRWPHGSSQPRILTMMAAADWVENVVVEEGMGRSRIPQRWISIWDVGQASIV